MRDSRCIKNVRSEVIVDCNEQSIIWKCKAADNAWSPTSGFVTDMQANYKISYTEDAPYYIVQSIRQSADSAMDGRAFIEIIDGNWSIRVYLFQIYQN